MACSCRTAALRIFVQNIARIQVPASAAPSLPRSLSAQAQPIYKPRTTTPCLPSSRTLHTSCARNSAAGEAASASAESGAEGAAKQEDGGSKPTARQPKKDEPNDDKERKMRRPKSEEEEEYDNNDDNDGGGGSGSGQWFERTKQTKKEPWMIQKEALKKKFPEGWNPRKRLSPDAIVGIRLLHKQFPDEYTTEVLAHKFEMSPEAIRRILRSKWTPTPEEEEDRQRRWFERGKKVWSQWAALGKKPPRKWRAEGIVRDPVWNQPRGPTHKDKDKRAEAQRRLAKAMKDMLMR
ncbi:hypothetical protein VTJ83DRAFT_6827 [Remersonia thermophila]|uniref:Required for respiratory growth protein 9, mitochondrial n=1 Tax=Remersonia thermophila TaxID=72144 RepID=A0ABR4D820_9PEZI